MEELESWYFGDTASGEMSHAEGRENIAEGGPAYVFYGTGKSIKAKFERDGTWWSRIVSLFIKHNFNI